MSNSNLAILSDPTYSHTFQLTIYYPGTTTVYSVFSSDQFSGNSDSSSIPSSKSFDSPPIVLSSILSVKLPENVIYSRQIISWPVEINTISKNGIVSSKNTMWKGKVNSFSKSGGTWSMELASDLIDINKLASIRLLANCPLVFGGNRCGATKVKKVLTPTSLIGFTLSFTPVPFVFDVKKRYQIVIGDLSYAISSLIIVSGNATGAILDRKPLTMPNYAVLENTCSQSIKVCTEGYQNNARYMGTVLPSSVLSLSL